METTKNYVNIAIVIIATIMVGAVLKITSSIILPLVVAFFLSGLLSPIMRQCARYKLPKFVAILTIILIIGIIFLLIILFLQVSVKSFVAEFPKYSEGFDNFARTFDAYAMDEFGFEEPILSNLNWQAPVMNVVSNFSTYVYSFVSNAGMTLLLTIFILIEQHELLGKLHHAFPERGDGIAKMFTRIGEKLSTYLLTKGLLSLVTGILFYFVALFTGLDFALIWGVMAFFFNFIPSIGSIIVTVLMILMACIQFLPTFGPVIVVAIGATTIQMVIGNFLDPKIQGDRLNLSPFILIVSLVLWGYLWGIVGMFLAVPITATLQIICDTVPGLRPIAIMLSGTRGLKFLDEQRMAVTSEESAE